MKKVLFFIGIFISALSGVKLAAIFLSGNNLTEFGKGFVTGNVALFILGLVVIFFSRRKSN